MLAHSVSGHENDFVKLSYFLSYEEAATLPCAALTVWNALMVVDGLKHNQTWLIQGTGGVAMFALQLAKAVGAWVIPISSEDEKCLRAKELGAEKLINYKRTPD